MPIIGPNCLIKNTDLAEKIKELIPILNLEVGSKNGKPTFRQVYKELTKMGVEIDLDTFADYYKSEIPKDFRFTSDSNIEDIVNARTKKVMDKLTNGLVDRIDGIGEVSPEREAIHKVAGILTTLDGKDKSAKTKTLSKTMKDAMLSAIDRLANSNEKYKELKGKDAKETFDQTLERVLETHNSKIATVEADKFNTMQDLFDESKKVVIDKMKDLRDEDGEPILGEEALKFLDDYKNASFGVMMSTGEANTLVRGALLEAGYGKGPEGKQVVDWKELAGSVNSPNVLRDNVVKALRDGKGLSEEAATSIADALSTDFKDLVQGQKAMDVKNSIAKGEAESIMNKLGWDPKGKVRDKVNEDLQAAIDKSVETSDDLNITEVVHDVLKNNGATQQQLANLPKHDIILKSNAADRIAKLVKGDGELDADALANLYGTLGKVVDADAINDLRRLSKLKDVIENLELKVDGSEDGISSKFSATKQGIEKAKVIKTISDQMARIVAKSIDYSDRNIFSRAFIHSMNALSKYTSANSALVLLNPFNLIQNILSGVFTGAHASVGGKVSEAFGFTKTPLTYTDPSGKKINLTELLNTSGKFDTWFNTLAGAEGRDIPDLFTGDASKDAKTFQNAETKGEKVEAALTAIPRAALTATDAMLKEPYFRKELIRGVLYHLQESGGKTKKEAQDLVYEALTKNSIKNLTKQATELASMVGKGKDKFYIKQVAEDIQLASLVLHDADGRSILSEQNLQSIIDAAKQTSGEAFGHKLQKDVSGLGWLYDIFTGGKAKAVEGLNREQGQKMAEYYKKGQYDKAAWLHFSNTLKTTMVFLFQRGIYNWAILMAQKNPITMIRGFRQLAREANFHTQESSQASVENFLRSRAKIGRGVAGTATALVVAPLVMAALGGTPEERRKKLAALRKDPVWGRVYTNFVSPVTQASIDAMLAPNPQAAVTSVFKDMAIQPVISAATKYYSLDNLLITATNHYVNGGDDIAKGDAVLGQILGGFLPGKNFLSTNKAWVERAFGKNSPELVDKNFQIVPDTRKQQKGTDFWDAFWYSSLFKASKKK